MVNLIKVSRDRYARMKVSINNSKSNKHDFEKTTKRLGLQTSSKT